MKGGRCVQWIFIGAGAWSTIATELTIPSKSDSILSMNEFNDPDWNLAQVAAWVVYRDAELVNQLANAGAHDFGAIGMYETMRPAHRQNHGALDDLVSALRNGSVEARGYHCDRSNRIEVIPKEAWADLHLRPPYAYKADNLAAQFQPWEHIRIENSAVKKQWPLTEKDTTHLQLHDWKLVKTFWESVTNGQSYRGSQRKLITEIQGQYGEQTSRTPPSRSQIQEYIKEWKLADPKSEN